MHRRDAGFTLVELMVVVLIVGILVAVAVPVFKSARDEAELKTCLANQRTIMGAVQAYNANTGKVLHVGDRTAVGGYMSYLRELDPSQVSTKYSAQRLIPEYLKSVAQCPTAVRTESFAQHYALWQPLPGDQDSVVIIIGDNGLSLWTGPAGGKHYSIDAPH